MPDRDSTHLPAEEAAPQPPLPYRGRTEVAPQPDAPAVEVSGLSTGYPDDERPALHELSLKVRPGMRIAVVGPNGAGKSTLLMVLAGLLRPRSGTIRLYGHPIGACHHRVAFLPQRSSVDWSFPLSVERMVMTGRYVHLGWLRRPRSRDYRRVDKVIEELGLTQVRKHPIGRLSGGMQQRVLLGRALAQEADLLLLDEPLNAVDAATRSVVEVLLERLRHEGRTVLIATHDIGRLEGSFDGAIYLSQGREVAPPPGSFRGEAVGTVAS